MQGIFKESAMYFPQSRTLPPPAAITESLLFVKIMSFILDMSS